MSDIDLEKLHADFAEHFKNSLALIPDGEILREVAVTHNATVLKRMFSTKRTVCEGTIVVIVETMTSDGMERRKYLKLLSEPEDALHLIERHREFEVETYGLPES